MSKNLTKKVNFLILFVLLCSIKLLAQTGTISGSVSDENSSPLGGVSIISQPGNKGTRTDADGKYALVLSPGKYKITASYAGKETAQSDVTVISGESVLRSFVLPNAGDLEGIMVIGSRSPRRVATETAVPVDV